MKLKIKIDDRFYKSWTLYTSDTLYELNKSDYAVDPIKYKLMNQDIFDYNPETHAITILHSSNREMPVLPGVIHLEKNQTYGKIKDKYYYKFVPDDKRLPFFLVPYKIKKLGFSKHIKNKYAVMRFKSWTTTKHPIGQLVNVIGNTDELSNFYEYQLFCKSLYSSIQSFTKQTIARLRETSEQTIIESIKEKYKLEDRTHIFTFSIDAPTSKDYDDAFSIIKNSPEKDAIYTTPTHTISIYIANVPIWLDIMNLWDSFSERVATIYLPDRKRPMLPTIMSDCLCSLCENNTRFAFALDLIIDETGTILDYSFTNTIINVNRNFGYETDELRANDNYKLLLRYLKRVNKMTKYIPKVLDSNHVVTYLMILMNYLTAKTLLTYKNGIYRSVKLNNSGVIPDTLPTAVGDFIRSWNSTSGAYATFASYESHDILDLDAYSHITSPIRRLVDILNMLDMQHNIGLVEFNTKSREFYDRWTSPDSIDYINRSMRSIRRIQRDCDLLTKYVNNPSMLEKEYDGYIFDGVCRNDMLYQYMVYLPDVNIVSKLTTRFNVKQFDKKKFTLFLFKDEVNLREKIKLNLIEAECQE